MKSIEWCKIIRYLQFFPWHIVAYLLFSPAFLYIIIMRLSLFIAYFVMILEKNGIYFDIFPLKVWRLSFNCLPLHSLSEIISVGTTKEAFFENIYIDREVVREARRVGLWA